MDTHTPTPHPAEEDPDDPFLSPIPTHPTRDQLESLYLRTHLDFHTSPSPVPTSFSFDALHTPQSDYHYAFFAGNDFDQDRGELVGGGKGASNTRRGTEWDVVLAPAGRREEEDARDPRRSTMLWDQATVHLATSRAKVENVRPYIFVRLGERSIAVPEEKILASLPTFSDKLAKKKKFPIEAYLELFEDTQLDSSSQSPEVDTILYRLLHRLLIRQPKLSLAHIDTLHVLPLTIKDITSLPHSTDLIPFPQITPSLLCDAFESEWDGPISLSVEAARRLAPESLRDVQGDSEALFCPMMGCGLYDCLAHAATIQKDEDIQPKERPLPPLSAIIEACRSNGPCSDGCFSLSWTELEDWDLIRQSVAEQVSPWPVAHSEELLDLVRTAPDLLPCGMTDVICDEDGYSPLYSCREYFEQMILLSPQIVPRQTRRIEAKKPKKGWPVKFTLDLRPTSLKPNRPCNHTGPCSQSTCICHKSRQHCLPSCHCPLECRRRHLFCDCHATRASNGKEKDLGRATKKGRGDLCRTRRCRCWKDNRECDPVGCGIPDATGGEYCGNACIQAGRTVQFKVREASYGYGLFLAPGEKLAKDDFILEYAGDIVDDNEADKRSIISSHIGLNYLFDLNKVQGVDAFQFGNRSRFINQPDVGGGFSNGGPNCYARTLNVLGEQRIGIYAAHDISSSNEELLLDYGGLFQIESPAAEAVFPITSKMARKSGPIIVTEITPQPRPRLPGTSGNDGSMGDDGHAE